MSEKQNQLKSPKAQKSDIYNGKERNPPYKTQKGGYQGGVSSDLQNQYMSVRSYGVKKSELITMETKFIHQVKLEVQQVKQLKQEPKQIQKKDELEVQDSIIPLSHAKRQKSLSPIKNQHSIASEQHFSTCAPKLNLTSIPKVYMEPQQSLKSQVKSSTSHIFIRAEQICNEPVTHKYREQANQRGPESGRRSHSRRTQIFSSDKKYTQKPLLSVKNSIAEQMLNQNNVERGSSRKYALHNDVYKSKPQKIENASPMQKKSRIESFTALSSNKSKQIQKLQEMFASPQKASQQYWESIYPQSKKYLNSLTSVLSEEKKVLQNWQSELQATLRQSLFEVEQILLQKLYEICRLTVKRWVQEQMQALEGFCKDKLSYFPQIKQNIEDKQKDLHSVQKSLQDFQILFKNDLERSRIHRLMQVTILSPEYTEEVSQISVKVKDIISKSEQVALQFCQDKLEKAKQLVSFQYDHDQYRLDTITYDLLKALFKKQQDPNKETIKKSSKKFILPDMNIGDKIQKIIQKSEIRNAETARQANFSEFSQNKYRMPMSHRKDNNGGFKFKDRNKEYEQFHSEFQMRKKNFVVAASSIYQEEKMPEQMPTPLKIEENGGFEKKLNTLLKKINDEKPAEQQDTAKNMVNTKNYNEYQQQLRKKKQNNRQNFFRYSVQ